MAGMNIQEAPSRLETPVGKTERHHNKVTRGNTFHIFWVATRFILMCPIMGTVQVLPGLDKIVKVFRSCFNFLVGYFWKKYILSTQFSLKQLYVWSECFCYCDFANIFLQFWSRKCFFATVISAMFFAILISQMFFYNCDLANVFCNFDLANVFLQLWSRHCFHLVSPCTAPSTWLNTL